MICRRCKEKESTHIFHCDDCYTCNGCGTKEKLVTRTEGLYCPACWDKFIQVRIDKFQEEEGDTQYTTEIVCPWCGSQNTDSWECGDSSDDEMCGDCGKKYSYERDIEVTYCSEKVEKEKD